VLNKICRGRVNFNMKMIVFLFMSWIKSKKEKAGLIKKFEKAFAKYIGTEYAISTSSAKTALCLALKSLGAEKNDEIIVSAYTVREVIDVLVAQGLIPVFIDINAENANMNTDLIAGKINEKTKFILMTHIYGCPCEVEAVLKISEKYNLLIIEDAAQACGAEYKQKKTGSFGKVAYFSFGMLKNLNTLGGGMIVTKEKSIAQTIEKENEKYSDLCSLIIIKRAFLAIAISFLTYPFFFSWLVYPLLFIYKKIRGTTAVEFLKSEKMDSLKLRKYNHRFSAVQAAMGLLQLGKIDELNNEKIRKAQILNKKLKNDGEVLILKDNNSGKNIYLNYVIRSKNRRKLVDGLFTKGIDISPGQVINCADLEDFGRFYSDCPNSRKLENENVYLPLYAPLKEEDMNRIANAIRGLN